MLNFFLIHVDRVDEEILSFTTRFFSLETQMTMLNTSVRNLEQVLTKVRHFMNGESFYTWCWTVIVANSFDKINFRFLQSIYIQTIFSDTRDLQQVLLRIQHEQVKISDELLDLKLKNNTGIYGNKLKMIK